MKALDQTILATDEHGNDAEGNPGNCYQACVASILEVPLHEVPHFAALPGEWWTNILTWAHTQGLIATALYPDDSERIEGIHAKGTVLGIIAVGPSPRGDYRHSIIVSADPDHRVLHDPHPSRAGITSIDALEIWWLPDPALADPALHIVMPSLRESPGDTGVPEGYLGVYDTGTGALTDIIREPGHSPDYTPNVAYGHIGIVNDDGVLIDARTGEPDAYQPVVAPDDADEDEDEISGEPSA